MRIFLKFFSIAFLVMAAAFFAFSAPFYRTQWRILRTWPEAQARVVRSEVVTMPTASGELYNTALEFEFDAHGERYRGGYVFPHASVNRAAKVKIAGQYPIGSLHAIRFNPEEPNDIRIHVGYNVDYFVVPVFISGLGMMAAAIAGILWLLSLLGRRAAAKTAVVA